MFVVEAEHTPTPTPLLPGQMTPALLPSLLYCAPAGSLMVLVARLRPAGAQMPATRTRSAIGAAPPAISATTTTALPAAWLVASSCPTHRPLTWFPSP